jgi:crossover junction endodeoxyribonuclease RuvC
MRILGIDPGLDGGIALLDSHAGLAVEVIPTIGTKRREVDGAALAHIIDAWRPDHAYLEKVGSRPGQGVRSMFTFGCTVGVVKGVLGALEIPFSEVLPQEWQSVVCAGCRSGDPKGAALIRARQLFPKQSFLATRLSKKPHRGLVDAACLAEYGHRICHHTATASCGPETITVQRIEAEGNAEIRRVMLERYNENKGDPKP